MNYSIPTPFTLQLKSSTYERMTGGCTRIIASQALSTISPPITNDSVILDNACGPGIVTGLILAEHPGAKTIGTDLSPDMISQFNINAKIHGWQNVDAHELDSRDLDKLADESFTHIITNLGLAPVLSDNDPEDKVIKGMFRLLKVGGVAVVTNWADRVWPVAYTNTALAIRPNEEPHKPFTMNPGGLSGSWLMRLFERGGFGNNIEIRPVLSYMEAKDLDELTDNAMLAKGMFYPGYSDSELEKAKPILREELTKCRTYEEFDGGVRIGMKAWIGCGWKKGDENEVPL